MPLTDDERKERRKQTNKKYRETHKEKIAELDRKYREENKEKIADYKKEYAKTPFGKKSTIIRNWKRMGIKSDNYDTLYDNYLKSTNCEECGIPYGKMGDGTGTYRCCDHDHTSGLFRNFLCCACNIKRG